MLQHATETLPDTCPEGTQKTVNMPPVMEQTSQLRCTQEQPNIAEENLTPGDNNYRTKQQVFRWHVGGYHGSPNNEGRCETREYLGTENPAHNSTRQMGEWQHRREKREPHKHRHEDRTDWTETLLSLTDDGIQLPTPTESLKRSKKPRTERELPTHSERTRSKTRQATPPKL